MIAAAYFSTNISRTLLFWAAFILTRPLGATLGDLLDKPLDDGGLAFSRFYASAILAAIIIACVAFFRNAPARIRESPAGKGAEINPHASAPSADAGTAILDRFVFASYSAPTWATSSPALGLGHVSGLPFLAAALRS